jgi:hypothetical protein
MRRLSIPISLLFILPIINSCQNTLEEDSNLFIELNGDFEITGFTYIDIVHVSEKESVGVGLFTEPPVLSKEIQIIGDSFALVYLDFENAPDRNYATERFVFRLHGINDSIYISRARFIQGGKSLKWNALNSRQVKPDAFGCLQGSFYSNETRERWDFYRSQFSAYLRDENENSVYSEGNFELLKENTIELKYTQFKVNTVDQSIPYEPDYLNCNCYPKGVTINNHFYERIIR